MSEKKTNEIIEAQRKARQDIIDLKKMQRGEMDAGPKPSETATVLKTPWQKFGNFWHYSKWFVISAVAITVLIAFMVAQCMAKPVYDLKVVYFTYTPALDGLTSPIADYLADYTEDVNGDGEVNIQIINCSVSDSQGDVMTRNSMLQKMYSVIIAEESALLFVTNEKSAAYFDGLTDEKGAFFCDSVALGEDFYEATKNDTFGKLPEGLTLSCRIVDGTVIEKYEDSANYFEAAKNTVKNIKNGNKVTDG